MKTYHRKLKLSKVQRAFGTLISLIEDGAEFPTAHERVCEELQLSESQSAALVRLYDTLPTGRAADQNSALAPAPTPEESGADSAVAAVNSGGTTLRAIIAKAEAAGLTIDDGNVVDLIADNLPITLKEIRELLVIEGFAKRFPKATLSVRSGPTPYDLRAINRSKR